METTLVPLRPVRTKADSLRDMLRGITHVLDHGAVNRDALLELKLDLERKLGEVDAAEVQ